MLNFVVLNVIILSVVAPARRALTLQKKAWPVFKKLLVDFLRPFFKYVTSPLMQLQLFQVGN
jgi:hypothetical protein